LIAFLGLVAIPAGLFAQSNNYSYILRTFAGALPVLGDGGPATSASLLQALAAVPDAVGNLYILDRGRNSIRKVTPDGTIHTFFAPQAGGLLSALTVGSDGSVYAAVGVQVLKISSSGTATVLAGAAPGSGGDGGPATAAQFTAIQGLALDSAGNIYVADGNRIREFQAGGNINTIAGAVAAGFGGDNGQASAALLNSPHGLAVDKSGNLYIADVLNFRIRKIAGGVISTFAGRATPIGPTSGPAASIGILPSGVAVDASNNVYATDSELLLEISNGVSKVVAGNFTSSGPFTDGPATAISLVTAVNVSVDGSGDWFVVDRFHVVKGTPDGQAHTVAGKVPYGGDGGPAFSALLNQPAIAAADARGNVFIADNGPATYNSTGRELKQC